MFEKPEITKEGVMKIVVALIIASIVLLSLSILTDDNDSRKQISDDDGATELCSILSEIKDDRLKSGETVKIGIEGNFDNSEREDGLRTIGNIVNLNKVVLNFVRLRRLRRRT